MSNQSLILRILSPEETLFEGEVSKEVLPGHAPIISSLTSGRISWESMDGVSGSIDIRCGLVRVDGGEVTVCIEK